MMIACDQVGAYVVDALTDEERAQFAAHLESCDSCQREVREFSETTAALATLVATAPPAGLRAQVLAQAAQVRPLPPLDTTVRTISRSETVPSSTVSSPVTSPAGPPRRADATVTSLDERRTGRRGFLRWGVAAAAVGVVSLGAAGTVSGWRTARTRGEAMTAQKELMAAPDAELVAFAPASGNDVKGSYLVSRQQNRAMFVAERMPKLPEGKVFQQWTIADAQSAPEANVTFDSITDAIWLTGDVARAAFLAISIENAGGATTVNPNTILGKAAL